MKTTILLIISIALFPVFASASYYRYTDDTGQLNITNDYKSIPERYRSNVTTISEQDLERRVIDRETKTKTVKSRKTGSATVAPTKNYVETQAASPTSETVASKEPEIPQQSWLARQLPILKIIGIGMLLFAGFIFAGKLVSSLAPRPLAIVIKVALFAAILVYLFKGYTERISEAFAKIKQEGNTAQKAVDKHNEKMMQRVE